MTVSLARLSLADAAELGARLRAAGEGATSMEEVAVSLVRLINEATVSEAGEASCVLVRCFTTIGRSRLPIRLVRLLQLDDDDDPDGRYLVLLATEGVEPDWCDRRRSRHHQSSPSRAAQCRRPFPWSHGCFANSALHCHRRSVTAPPSSNLPTMPSACSMSRRRLVVLTFRTGTFIAEYRVASVVGVGGRLPTGDVFAVLCFSREPISRQIAEPLQPLAMSIKLAFLPVFERVFADDRVIERPLINADERLRIEATTLRTLLKLQEASISDQHRRLLASSANRPDTDLTEP